MPRYAINRVLLMVIFGVAIAVVIIVFNKGLIHPNIPLPEDTARLTKYLECSFALCAYGCNTPEVIDIEPEMGLGCNDVFNCSNKPKGEHLCGSDYKLNFTFQNEVNYNSNKTVPASAWWCGNSIQNDVLRFANKKIWYDNLRGCHGPGKDIKLDDFEVDSGCGFDILCNQWWGTCYGMLRGSGSCSKGSTSYSVGAEYVGTGHLWLDPKLIANCKEFVLDGEGDPYYGKCKFESGLNISIWAEPDTYTENPCWPRDCTVTVYCPELVICTS